eukprot:5658104-Amphidinium_carterae.1
MARARMIDWIVVATCAGFVVNTSQTIARHARLALLPFPLPANFLEEHVRTDQRWTQMVECAG